MSSHGTRASASLGTRVCYVLTAEGWDRHARMMWLSATSLKLHEPNVRITLVTDPISLPKLTQFAPQLLELVHEIVEVDPGTVDLRLRAFHLKTLLRRHVSGDFLYLDGDTLVIRPVGDVFSLDADIAAALDFNHDGEWFPPQLMGPYTRLGWTCPLPYYFNSGVVMMRDTAGARSFSDEWNRRWTLLVGEGMPGDQEAFVSALYAVPVKWARLSKAYNAIVVKRNYRFRESRVLHFFGSVDEQRGTIMAHLLQHLDATGTFDRTAYERSIRQGHPWGPNPEPWQLYRSRNYVRAAVAKASRTTASLFRRRARVADSGSGRRTD